MADFAPDLMPLLVTLPSSVGVQRTPEAIKVRYPRYIDAVLLAVVVGTASGLVGVAIPMLLGGTIWRSPVVAPAAHRRERR